MENNYPVGVEYDQNAPWNQSSEPNIEEIEVTSSNTLSKNSTIEVVEGNYDSSVLKREWRKQNYSAKEALDFAAEFAKKIYVGLKGCEYLKDAKAAREEAAKVFNVCNGWEEDEFEVVMD